MTESYPEYYKEEDNIDIKRYIFLILSHWWWFALSIFIALTISYLVNRYTEEIYQVSCSLILGDETTSGSVEDILDELTRTRNRRRKAVVENEISILKSYSMARMALEELDFRISYTAVGRRGIAESRMYKDCPFVVIPDSANPNLFGYPVYITILSRQEYLLEIDDRFGISKTLRFGENFKHSSFNFTVRLRNPDYKLPEGPPRKYYFTMNSINSLANQYRGALSVQVNDPKGSIISLSMQGFVSFQIADYLNKLSEVYIRFDLDEKNTISENTIRFIDEQLNQIVDSLKSAEMRLQNFRAHNKVIDISREGEYMFKQLEELQTEKAVLDLNTSYYDYLKNYVNKKTGKNDIIAPSVIGVNDQLLNDLVSRLNELNLHREKLSYGLQGDMPQYTEIVAQTENVRKNLIENLDNLVHGNKLAINDLNKRIRAVEKNLEKLPYTERQLINIQREFNLNDQIYTFLLEKRAEAGITKASNAPKNKILDIARPENAYRIKPKSRMNNMMAMLLGGLFPLFLILLIDFFNNKIQSRKDIENYTKVPILGTVGHNDSNIEIPVIENPKSSLAESFRALRANLHYLMKDQGDKIIAVTSTISGEGKTFCAVNMAAIMAMAGKKTLLVGLDLRRPKIHKIFNINNTIGLSTYLIHKSTPEEIISATNIDRLFVVNSGPIPPNPAELIGSDKLTKFMLQAKKDFDYIILDTPPIAIVTDALLLSELADIYLFVVRHKYSSKNVLQIIDELYRKKNMKKLSILINDVHTKGYYGYSYRYGYDYAYGYGNGYGNRYYYDDEYVQDKKSILYRIYKTMFKIK